ncbi:MAG TPA: carboxypeptidase regulatory-like domain-containing protein [Candidatus Acidoferrales bacterium]|nr:carboxypeptidase regulatory-like domain-containing protein [Candidatus Acidoferrales bacterium]
MLSKRVVLVVVAVACLLTLVPSAVMGQASSTGSVNGLVTDPTGATVVGATVTLTDKATNKAQTTNTNDAGRYAFLNVFPGTYDIRVTMKGFRQLAVPGQEVVVGQVLTVNAKLELGAMAEIVEVKVAQGAELQTENATMGSTVSNDILLAMPNLDRDASALLTLQPATSPAVNNLPGGSDIYGGQVAGSMSDQNTYMLDGGNITSDLEGDNNYVNNGVGGRGAIPTPAESIEEFKVATNNQTADFSSSAGGQVMMVTKRGTNKFHGSAYEFFHNQSLNANDWASNRLHEPLVKFHDNRFGGGVGGPLLPGRHLGGKTYFYGFYEGHRYPGIAAFDEWTVPSALMRQGILQFLDSTGTVHQVDLKTSKACNVTATNPTGACDPRGIGVSPVVLQLWSLVPLPNDPTGAGDHLNTQGFRAPLALPVKDNYGAVRLDHDFSDNWRFTGSYRISKEVAPSANQIDIGGILPGDRLGVPAASSSNPSNPRYAVLGLNGTITPRLVNEFHVSYMLNSWGWQRQGVTNAISGVPAGLEFADTHFGCMCPMNMDTQDARKRVWDGHDWTYNDTLSWVKGTHFLQFGGSIVHWWDHHVRDDQVVAGLPELVYQLTKATGLKTSADNRPVGLPSSRNGTWDTQYAQTLGILGTGAQLFVRGGSDFHLTGAKSFQDTSLIDSYTLYYNDTWKMRPSITLNYGLDWGVQMPPYEVNGVQDFMVDSSGAVITTQQYLQNTVNDALKGQVYNPVLGFEPIGAVGGHPKYPFNPWYGGFSPRVSVAWNPKFQSGFLQRVFGNGKTVFRGGYARMYDRNNGVDLVLVPLLGYGFGQTIRCNGAGVNGACNGGGGTTPTTAFRIGVDGTTGPFPAVQQTLPIPAEPGINSAPASNVSFLDNNWRPGANDQFSVGIQRELPDNMILEVAWVGKWSKHLYQGLDLNNVPWMLTLGGQSFAKAYAALWNADHNKTPIAQVAPQPFFENALLGSPLCVGFANCSAAVLANEGAAGTGNIGTENVYGMFQDLDRGVNCSPACPFTAFGGKPALPADLQGYNSMLGNTTLGFSNYQAGIVRLQKRAGHGLTMNANLTWSHTLATVGINQEYTQANPSVPFDLRFDYGPAPFDTRWVFNTFGVYELPFGKGKPFASHNAILDKVIGGWSFNPIFQWNSGLVQETYTGSCDEFGQGNVPFCSGFAPMQGVNLSSISRTAHFGVTSTGGVGSNGDASNGGAGVNMFANPQAVYNMFRPVILGQDGRANDLGPLYGQHRWNLDFSVTKTTKITEQVGFTFYAEFFNGLNHMEFQDPGQYGAGGLNLQDPSSFGVLNSQFNKPRNIYFGLRVFF